MSTEKDQQQHDL